MASLTKASFCVCLTLLWRIFLICSHVKGLAPSEGLTRRDALRFSASLASAASIVPRAPVQAESLASPDASKLLSLIPSMEYDAPATNATVPKELSQKIEALARSIENQQSNNAQSPLLKGNWKLLYSNGAEITSLATNLPLGFRLGKTTQPVGDVFFENRGTLEHPLGLAHWQTNVVGDVRVAPSGSLNAVGVVNDRNNRVDVDFKVLVFVLDKVLGRPVRFQKTLIPKPLAEGQAQPANDVTYLDENVRIVRGGDGALFVFERDENVDLLTIEERKVLLREAQGKSDKVDVGIGVAEKSSSPELQFLFQERNGGKQ